MRTFIHKTTKILGTNDPNFDSFLHITREDNYIESHETIPMIFIQNSNDWEEVIEKDYEILNFINPNSKEIFYKVIDCLEHHEYYSTDKKSNCYGLGDRKVEYVEKYYNIHSVKRLSDGEIFSIGDKFKTSHLESNILEKIYLYNDKIYFNDSVTKMENKFRCQLKHAIKLKQPLFITEDGVEIFNDNTLVYTVSPNNFRLGKWYVFMGRPYIKNNHKLFSTKEAAKQYVIENKPCLSYNDIKKAISNDGWVDGQVLNQILKYIKKSNL